MLKAKRLKNKEDLMAQIKEQRARTEAAEKQIANWDKAHLLCFNKEANMEQ